MATSRTIFGGALGLALAFALGCGSKPAPSAPSPEEAKTDQDSASGPKADPPKAEPAKVVWEMDPDKHVIPAAPVTGTLGGAAFVPTVSMEGPELKFRVQQPDQPNPEREVTITLPPGSDGRAIKVKPDLPNAPDLPKIFALFPPPAAGQPGGALFPGSHASYALTLELGARKDGKVTGRIYLAMQDESKSVMAGTFTADYTRPPTERPGADEAPYIVGDVIAIGAGPKPEVRVTYAAFLPDGTIPVKDLMIAADDQVQWTRDDNEKPRVSTLVAGDGKARPFKYEHTRLSPGRYLLSAAAKGGPAVWRWVEVPEGGMLTENFVVDVANVGGLEITVPANATGKVMIVPAADPARPALDAKLFEVLAILSRIDAEILAGKGVVKNLGIGKYEVRQGDERRIVEVVPGKTAEVNLTPAKK